MQQQTKTKPYDSDESAETTPTSMSGTLLVDLRYRTSGEESVIPAGTRIAILELGAHDVTNLLSGCSHEAPAGELIATPDGERWLRVRPHQFEVDC